LMHSFGLYSKVNGKEYRFRLTCDDNPPRPLVSAQPSNEYFVDLRALHRTFEKAVDNYKKALESNQDKLQKKFNDMFDFYGFFEISAELPKESSGIS
jgi:hypothetical protein